MTITRRRFIQQTTLGTVGFCGLPLLAGNPLLHGGAPAKPNILFLFPDQWRRQAFSRWGDPNVRTPNLDRLAAEGTEFTRAYSNHPVCSPARSMLMTGLYTHQNGFLRNNFYLEQHPENLGYRLKDVGYRTGYIGKWHLDGHERPGFVPPHRRQGWDDFHGFNRGHWYRLNDPKESQARYFTPDGELVYSDVFEPILQTDIALDFIKRQEPDQPWALTVSYGPPHDPYTPPPSHQRHDPSQIHWRPNVPEDAREHYGKDIAGYYGLCELIDEQIGRLLDHLESSGLADNTLVIFSSDHGDMLGSQGRGQKLVPWEESAGIPLVVRGPGVHKGHTSSQLVSIIDFAPTLLALAGTTPSPRMVGRDISPVLRGEAIQDRPVLLEGFMHMEQRQWRSLVTDRYKLTLVAEEKAGNATHSLLNQLYDLEEDPYETNNLYHHPDHQNLVRQLTALRSTLAARTGDAFPGMSTPAPEHPPA